MASIDKKTGKLIYEKITSNQVVQANYLASKQDEYWIDDGINFYTGLMPWNFGTPPCSHTEIGFCVDGELWFFSSTSRKELGSSTSKKNGTRWIKAEDMLRHPDRWLLQVMSYDEACTYHKIRYTDTYVGVCPVIEHKIDRANNLVGAAYDFYGVFADFTNPCRVLCNGKYLTCYDMAEIKKIYCSKAVHVVDTGKLCVMSPKHRFKVADSLGYTTIKVSTAVYMANKKYQQQIIR